MSNFWVGGGSAHECPHSATWGNCTHDGCSFNPVKIAADEAARNELEKLQAGFVNLPKQLQEKFNQHCAGLMCGWSDVQFTKKESEILASVGFGV